MTLLAQPQIVGLNPWQKFAFFFSIICAVISLTLIIMLVVWHLIDEASVENDAREEAFQTAVRDATSINEALLGMLVIAEAVSEDLSSGDLTPAELEDRLNSGVP